MNLESYFRLSSHRHLFPLISNVFILQCCLVPLEGDLCFTWRGALSFNQQFLHFFHADLLVCKVSVVYLEGYPLGRDMTLLITYKLMVRKLTRSQVPQDLTSCLQITKCNTNVKWKNLAAALT